MGNSFSSGNNVYVYVDRPSYHGGDVVNGYCLLNCVKPFECSRVLLNCKGYESAYWEERHERREVVHCGNGETKTETIVEWHPRHAHRDFFSAEIQLYSWPQLCVPGQYQFPFSFVLPRGLPGSFELRESDSYRYRNTKAKVRYKIKAECVVPGVFKPNVRHKAYLTVFQQLDKPPSEIRASHAQDVTKCCCCGMGNASVTAHIQKDSYAPGETACLLLEVDNNSEAEFQVLKVKVKRKVNLDGGGSWQRIDDDLAEQAYPGIGPHSRFIGADARGLQIRLPESLRPTTLGAIVRCEYKLQVKLGAGAFITDVELSVPVLVYMPSPQHVVYTQPPSWWNATLVAPPVQLSLPATAPLMPPQAQQMGGDRAYQPQQGGAPAPYPQPQQGGMPPGYPQQGGAPAPYPQPQQGGAPYLQQQQGPPVPAPYNPQAGGYPPQAGYPPKY